MRGAQTTLAVVLWKRLSSFYNLPPSPCHHFIRWELVIFGAGRLVISFPGSISTRRFRTVNHRKFKAKRNQSKMLTSPTEAIWLQRTFHDMRRSAAFNASNVSKTFHMPWYRAFYCSIYDVMLTSSKHVTPMPRSLVLVVTQTNGCSNHDQSYIFASRYVQSAQCLSWIEGFHISNSDCTCDI